MSEKPTRKPRVVKRRPFLWFKRVFSRVLFWFVLNVVASALLLVFQFGCEPSLRFPWWDDFYAVASSLLLGGFVSFLFYFLVVYLPEKRKRNSIKLNFKKLYYNIKRDILREVIVASQKGGRDDLVLDAETIDTMMTIDGFKAAFEGGREGDEGFYAFQNYMIDDVPEYRAIILNLQLLLKQIDYVLHNYSIDDPEVFDFFKRLEIYVMRLERIGPGYNEEKELSQFILEIFSGWNWVEGYQGYDVIDKMIKDL